MILKRPPNVLLFRVSGGLFKIEKRSSMGFVCSSRSGVDRMIGRYHLIFERKPSFIYNLKPVIDFYFLRIITLAVN